MWTRPVARPAGAARPSPRGRGTSDRGPAGGRARRPCHRQPSGGRSPPRSAPARGTSRLPWPTTPAPRRDRVRRARGAARRGTAGGSGTTASPVSPPSAVTNRSARSSRSSTAAEPVAPRTASHSGSGHPFQHRAPDQQVALLGVEAGEHLGGEVVEDVPLVAADHRRGRGRVVGAAQGERGELQPGRPALGALGPARPRCPRRCRRRRPPAPPPRPSCNAGRRPAPRSGRGGPASGPAAAADRPGRRSPAAARAAGRRAGTRRSRGSPGR